MYVQAVERNVALFLLAKDAVKEQDCVSNGESKRLANNLPNLKLTSDPLFWQKRINER